MSELSARKEGYVSEPLIAELLKPGDCILFWTARFDWCDTDEQAYIEGGGCVTAVSEGVVCLENGYTRVIGERFMHPQEPFQQHQMPLAEIKTILFTDPDMVSDQPIDTVSQEGSN